MSAEELTELRLRVDAIESRFSAVESRVLRVERLVGDIQIEARLQHREVANKLDTLLDLLQPKAVLP